MTIQTAISKVEKILFQKMTQVHEQKCVIVGGGGCQGGGTESGVGTVGEGMQRLKVISNTTTQ